MQCYNATLLIQFMERQFITHDNMISTLLNYSYMRIHEIIHLSSELFLQIRSNFLGITFLWRNLNIISIKCLRSSNFCSYELCSDIKKSINIMQKMETRVEEIEIISFSTGLLIFYCQRMKNFMFLSCQLLAKK